MTLYLPLSYLPTQRRSLSSGYQPRTSLSTISSSDQEAVVASVPVCFESELARNDPALGARKRLQKRTVVYLASQYRDVLRHHTVASTSQPLYLRVLLIRSRFDLTAKATFTCMQRQHKKSGDPR